MLAGKGDEEDQAAPLRRRCHTLCLHPARWDVHHHPRRSALLSTVECVVHVGIWWPKRREESCSLVVQAKAITGKSLSPAEKTISQAVTARKKYTQDILSQDQHSGHFAEDSNLKAPPNSQHVEGGLFPLWNHHCQWTRARFKDPGNSTAVKVLELGYWQRPLKHLKTKPGTIIRAAVTYSHKVSYRSVILPANSSRIYL